MSTAVAKSKKQQSYPEYDGPLTDYVFASDSHLHVHLTDGRLIVVPLSWYPRLTTGTPAERNRWELIGEGVGIHWPDLDEDLGTDGIVAGRKSGESKKSFNRWLKYYRRGEKVPVLELPLPDWAKM